MFIGVITKAMQGFFSGLKTSRGYTLTEVAAVVAVSGIVTAVALPAAIEQVHRAKVTKAQEDSIHFIGAITSFIHDTGELPIRRVAQVLNPTIDDRFFFNVLLSTRFRDKGTPGAVPEAIPPNDNKNGDFFSGVNARRIGTLEAPLFTNRASDIVGGEGSNGNLYNPDLWRGPYQSRRGLDPWGHSYVVFLRGLRENLLAPERTLDPARNRRRSPFKLWVLSAGPNGKLETVPTDESPRGDDIGVVGSG